MKVDYVDLPAQHAPLRDSILEAIGRVLDHGQFILGPEVVELEAKLRELTGAEDVVTVNSGTDALVYALRLRGIGPGDEVLTVAHSFVATAAAIVMTGARPVFVDIEEETMLMDVAKLDRHLSDATRAVIPVHLNGYPCDIDALSDFCQKNDLHLIEDCAQSIGARYRGEHVGVRDLGAFSLHPLKPLSACGDGGFVTTSNLEEGRTLRELRNIGLRDRDHCVRVSGNSRLDTLQAAILLEKMKHFESWVNRRRENARAYQVALERKVTLPPDDDDRDPAWSAFVIRHPDRDRLLEWLRSHGVDAKIHYPIAIHQQEAYECWSTPLPVTEKVLREMISLPVSAELTGEQRDHVINTLLEGLEPSHR